MSKKKSESLICMGSNKNGKKCKNRALKGKFYCRTHYKKYNPPNKKKVLGGYPDLTVIDGLAVGKHSDMELIKNMPDIKLPMVNTSGLIVKPKKVFKPRSELVKDSTFTWMPPNMKGLDSIKDFNFENEMMNYPKINDHPRRNFSFQEFKNEQPQLSMQWITRRNEVFKIENVVIDEIEQHRDVVDPKTGLSAGVVLTMRAHTKHFPIIQVVSMPNKGYELRHPTIIEIERIKAHNLQLMDANSNIKQSAREFKAKFISAEKVSNWAITKLLTESMGKDEEIERLETKNEELKIIKEKKEGSNLITIIEKKDNFIRHLMKRLEEKGETND